MQLGFAGTVTKRFIGQHYGSGGQREDVEEHSTTQCLGEFLAAGHIVPGFLLTRFR
jgi:hypothetical protein